MIMKTTVKDRVMLAAPATIMGSSLRVFLSGLSEIEYMGSTDQADGISDLLSEYRPDTLVLDAHLVQVSSGLHLDAYLERLHRLYPHTKIIVVLTDFTQSFTALRCSNVQFVSQDEMGRRLMRVLFARKFIRPVAPMPLMSEAYVGS